MELHIWSKLVRNFWLTRYNHLILVQFCRNFFQPAFSFYFFKIKKTQNYCFLDKAWCQSWTASLQTKLNEIILTQICCRVNGLILDNSKKIPLAFVETANPTTWFKSNIVWKTKAKWVAIPFLFSLKPKLLEMSSSRAELWRFRAELGHFNFRAETELTIPTICMSKNCKFLKLQSNLAIRNGLIRNKLVLGNHFLWPICHLLHKDKELLALRNNFRATKKFLIAKFDCISNFFYSKPKGHSTSMCGYF